jgi:Flp pilus assembly protein TadG
MRLLKILRNHRGAAAIEMAIALPILVFTIYGIFESSMLLKASAGMQHAVGEGARLATIYPTPANSAVTAKVNDELFGMEEAKSGFPLVSVVKANSTTQQWYTITVTFKKDVDFLFLPSREVTLVRSKRVYTAQ